MLWNEIGMTTQAVACSFDVHDDSVMEETIQQSGRHDWISVSGVCTSREFSLRA